jgi:hypothetical protein
MLYTSEFKEFKMEISSFFSSASPDNNNLPSGECGQWCFVNYGQDPVFRDKILLHRSYAYRISLKQVKKWQELFSFR